MLTYKYNEALELLEARISGGLKINDIVNHYKELSENVSLPFNLKVMIDCRGTDFDIKPEEINLTYQVLKNALSKYTHIREAIVVNQPHATVIATLFQNNYYDLKKYSFMIFSTKRAALSWLK